MRNPELPTFLPSPRRRSRSGLVASSLFHGVVLLLVLSPWFRRYHLLSPEGSDRAGTGGGGGGAQYISLPALRPAPAAAPVVKEVVVPVVPPPTTVPTVIPPPTPIPDSVPKQVATAPAHDSSGGAPGTGLGAGGGTGGGTGGGQGPGTGGGAGPGTGGGRRGSPPEQRRVIVPPVDGIPKELRGRDVMVRFFVSATGTVDRIETVPEIPSGGYRRTFEDAMLGFKFRPARDSTGAAVPGITTATVTLSNH